MDISGYFWDISLCAENTNGKSIEDIVPAKAVEKVSVSLIRSRRGGGGSGGGGGDAAPLSIHFVHQISGRNRARFINLSNRM